MERGNGWTQKTIFGMKRGHGDATDILRVLWITL